MILFYSEYCPHCRMLLDTIGRYDSKGVVKKVSIDVLRKTNRPIPPKITTVPALVLLPSKEVIYGKDVFDYLLLPGRGVLWVGAKPTTPEGGTPPPAAIPDEPGAYSAHGGGFSDAFAPIEGDGMEVRQDCSYVWSSIEGGATQSMGAPVSSGPSAVGEETRAKKESLDLDTIRAQRDADLRGDFTKLIPARI